ncbi:peptidoglycan editing factor PgeF [Microvirga pudoricolor]|uniref:peptidoglycan editing factor PgeF n=1 Tax=Microvirga pudoricolor TaxID=2778729 RepID=UPI00194DBC15|nr:peptidoglycan editing factor PgeF [Microvirga pudoricolor]MBM6592764.1 peptidoglycan editing factor PgeF [Microvirga pudoricolor]
MFIEAPELASYPNIRHAFFTRQGGVSEGIYASLNGGIGSSDDRAHVAENRRRMAEDLGVEPEALLSLYQIHSPDVVVVDAPWAGDRPKADALVTRTPGIALAISTADCGPVLFADHHAGVIGAAHAGWRGAFTGVLEATVDAMEAQGAERGNIVAVLGPTISQAAYEVGPDFVARFLEADADHARFFIPSERPDHSMFDLPAFIGARLEGSGIGEFANTGLCTYADEERFYSYRRTTHRGEPDYGRLISAIRLTH